jgi:AAA+ ATPase superfamily predicted ATPase
MLNIAGSPVEGTNFFGRSAEVERIRETLLNDDVLLLGPRRIGKTSIARAVMKKAEESDWKTIEINVAACTDEREFLEKLDAAIVPLLASLTFKTRGAIVDAFSSMAGRIKSIKIPVPGAGDFGVELGNNPSEDWMKVGNDVLSLIAEAEESWLVYVDELPILLFNIIRQDPVTGVHRVRKFLDWFRNDVRAIPGAKKVKWLISGSVGLDTLVQQHGMADTINSLSHQTLDAFEEEVAVEMLVKLGATYSIEITEENARCITNAVLWLQPYYLQAAFNHLRTIRTAKPNANLDELVAEAVGRMSQPGADNDFHHWEQRLTIQLSIDDAEYAAFMLSEAARDPMGQLPEVIFERLGSNMQDKAPGDIKKIFVRLRDILIRDAYWWADESSGSKRYRFRLEPLRQWWLRRDTL